MATVTRPSLRRGAARIGCGVAWLAVVSCGSEKKVTTSSAPARGINKYMLSEADVKFGDAGSDEEGLIVGGKRSTFEGRTQNVYGGEYTGKSYQGGKFATGNWNGSKEARTGSYQGGGDGERFQFSSLFGARQARETSNSSRYDGGVVSTTGYGTGSARESGHERISKPGDAETQVRRRVYPEPVKRSLREHQEMTIQETNSLLGRE